MTIGIFGRRGSGKSLIQTIIGVLLTQEKGIPLYSNYQVLGSKKITMAGLFKVEGGVILLDELWTTLDSRNYGDKINIIISRWYQQQRKKNLIILYTTQALGQLEKRIRESTDYFIYCEKKGDKQKEFRYTIIDGYTNEKIKEIKTDEERIKRFYKYYDTLQYVDTLTATDELGEETRQELEQEHRAKVERMKDDILARRQAYQELGITPKKGK